MLTPDLTEHALLGHRALQSVGDLGEHVYRESCRMTVSEGGGVHGLALLGHGLQAGGLGLQQALRSSFVMMDPGCDRHNLHAVDTALMSAFLPSCLGLCCSERQDARIPRHACRQPACSCTS